MYRADGVTVEFPLPVGNDGRVVALWMESGCVRMEEGEAYEVIGGCVKFLIPPPVGTTVVFEMPGEGGVVMRGVCTVIYPDGRLEVVDQDPYELLLVAHTERQEAVKLLKETRGAQERVEHLVYTEAQMAKDNMQISLLGYSTQAEAAITNAVTRTKEEMLDQFNRVILEIRNKHKAVVAAHDVIETAMARVDCAAREVAVEAVEAIRRECADVLGALGDVRALRAEVVVLRDEARSAAMSAGMDVMRTFDARSELVLEELRGVRSSVLGEIRAVIERLRTDSACELEQVRALRAEMVRASKRFEGIERSVRDAEDRMRGVRGDD